LRHLRRRSQRGWASAPRIFGSFAVPEGSTFGTTKFGNGAHDAIVKLLRERYPRADFIFRAGRGQTGVDVEVVGQRSIDAVGFRYAEVKPLADSGRARFYQQVFDWDLPEPVQPITYDAAGNVFTGFH
jgi:hypothetical protein